MAERILHELPLAAVWQPVLAGALTGASSPAGAGSAMRAQVEQRAQELGLQRLRWPAPFPFDSALAMRVAAYAQQIGRAVAFAQAAFRQAYAGGRSLQEPDNVLIAAAACEMHPAAVLRAMQSRSVAAHLERMTAGAARAGVCALPAIVLPAPGGAQSGAGGRVLQGPDALADALAALAGEALR